MFEAVPNTDLDQGCLVGDAPFYAIKGRREAIILTPRCDIAQDKVDYVFFSAIYTLDEFLRAWLRGAGRNWNGMVALDEDGAFAGELSLKQRNAFRKETQQRVDRILRSQQWRYHWLSDFDGSGPRIVDFDLVGTLLLAEARAKLKIVASLVSPFREQVSARFAAYVGRIGTPLENADLATEASYISEVVASQLGHPE